MQVYVLINAFTILLPFLKIQTIWFMPKGTQKAEKRAPHVHTPKKGFVGKHPQ